MDRVVRRSAFSRLKPWLIGGAALALCGLSALVLLPPPGSAVVSSDDIRTADARRGLFDDVLPVRATVEPLTSVFVDAVEGGRIGSLAAEDGQIVEEGQLIATLANPQLQLQVLAQEAAISGQLGNITAQELALEGNRLEQQKALNESNYNQLQADRMLQIKRHLNALDIESDAALQNAEATAAFYAQEVQAASRTQVRSLALSESQSREMQSTATRLRANLQAVRASLKALEIRAPVAGRLTALDLDIGQTIQPGTRIAQVDSEKSYKLSADIDEFYLGRLSIGRAGEVLESGSRLPVRISRILSQVTEGKFRIELTFDEPESIEARRGQTFDVRISLGQSKQALLVPVGPWLDTTGGRWVFVLDGAGRAAERRTIETGRRNTSVVEVLNGLSPGERIVTSAYEDFKNHDRLAVR